MRERESHHSDEHDPSIDGRGGGVSWTPSDDNLSSAHPPAGTPADTPGEPIYRPSDHARAAAGASDSASSHSPHFGEDDDFVPLNGMSRSVAAQKEEKKAVDRVMSGWMERDGIMTDLDDCDPDENGT